MTFAQSAVHLCGQLAMLLGWRPSEFWNSTPAEVGCILNAAVSSNDCPPDSDDLQQLMRLFPDEKMETHDE